MVALALLLAAVTGLTSYAQGPEPPNPRAPQDAAGTAFTYQGQLKQDGEPVNAECEMAFRLYDDGGIQVGAALTHTVAISDGLFTQALDFGAGVFGGDARWLGIRVRCPGDAGFTDLGRQELTAAPYAQYARSTGALHGYPLSTTGPITGQVLAWDGATWGPAFDQETTYAAGNQLELDGNTFNVLEGSGSGLDADLLDGQDGAYYLDWANLSSVPAGLDDGDDNTTYSAGTGLDLTGTEFSITPPFRLPQTCTGGQAAVWNGTTWACSTVAGGDVAGVYAGLGLTGGGASGEVTLTVAFSGTGSANWVARSDHDHNGVYALVGHTHPGADITSPVAAALNATWATTATHALNADTLDGQHADAFASAVHTHAGSDITSPVATATLAYSATAAPWAGLTGVPVGFADGVDDDTTYTAGNQLSLLGTRFDVQEGSGSGLDADMLDGRHGTYYQDASNINAGTLAVDYFSAYTDLVAEGYLDNDAAGDLLTRVQSDGRYWMLGGNAVDADSVLGTTNGHALDIRVNDIRALRLEPNATSPNLLGGHSGNWVVGGVAGATIGGGGGAGSGANRVSDDFGTVGGGYRNQAGDDAGTTDDRAYATVGGGYINTASGKMATVGGGGANRASGWLATVAGGWIGTADGDFAAVGGGYSNAASGQGATVAGGWMNTASGIYATVAGGDQNVASGTFATVGGGFWNAAAADHSFAAGSYAQANHQGAFVWADSLNAFFSSTANNQFAVRATGGVRLETSGAGLTVDGNTAWHAGNDGSGSGLDADRLDGQHASAFALAAHTHPGSEITSAVMTATHATTATYALVAGDADTLDGQHASAFAASTHDHDGRYWLLGGNAAGAEGVLGTTDNYALDLHVNDARALRLEPNATSPNLIGGYSGNSVSSGVAGATIGGGGGSSAANRVTDNYGTVGGGRNNRAGNDNYLSDDATYATVCGGENNTADRYHSTVGGGSNNTANGSISTVGGGSGNYADYKATVAGGHANVAAGTGSAIGGGVDNLAAGEEATIGGGGSNRASAWRATVGGGWSNEAGGRYAAIPGGYDNAAAGDYSLAAGRRAQANHQGAFVWADSTDADFASTADNQFAVRASGGVWLQTNGAGLTVDMHMAWHEGNDGSGSGLDADRLDGQHATAFAPAAHTHTGDEITTAVMTATYATTALVAGDADTLDGQDGSYYQARVSGACAVGSTVRAVNADGTVVCQVDAPLNRAAAPAANTLTVLDNSSYYVGEGSSVTIGADGLGLISYYDLSNGDLKVAHCSDTACTAATITALDTATDYGEFNSVAIGADGLGLISYYNAMAGTLRVAHCSNVACTAATKTTLDSSAVVGSWNSVAIGADGLGLISYYDLSNGNLKVAHCSNTNCTAATISTLDSGGDVGWFTSVAIGADGLGLISYYDATNGDLRVAHCSNVACTAATTATLDSGGDVGRDATSVTIGADGLGLISYYDYTNGDLRVAHCSDVTCSTATTATLDSGGIVGRHSSITIGADGLGLISYYDDTNQDLKVAHCSNVACTAATLTTVDGAGFVGQLTAITVGVDGLGLISYYDGSGGGGSLKVAHCSNAFCTPYFRRR